MLRKVLIVDDSSMNRQVLNGILNKDYDVTLACNGQEALDFLFVQKESYSAVLLDLKMPVLDGFGVLEAMQKDPLLSQIPVIVTTGDRDETNELRALNLGANDFAMKPYNTRVLKMRLTNLINLRETAAIINATTRDALTGLLNRHAFFTNASKMVATHEAGYYVMGFFNINNFKLINDRYGNATGDLVLIHIAKTFDQYLKKIGGICSRITEDKFAAFFPTAYMDCDEMKLTHQKAATLDGASLPLSFCYGRYIVDDLSLSASAMYDRAVIAGDSIKGRFDQQIAIYDESMRLQMLKEDSIISEMESALESNQFAVWFQPQYNHASGAMIGSEALVRWFHPDRGMISPGDFIPVFEKNGFIYELDRFVWEQVCRYLRQWTDEGLEPLPVSINISRYDILHEDLVDTIVGLIQQYQLPPDMLRLEITESAFTESTNRIITVAKELLDCGFTLEIDDFGSGYSSLNTLKDVPAQVVKLDMKFLEGDDNSGRGGNIIESVVRMSKWLGMSVLAEGVETREQADYLKSIGCHYVQGYYYAKPMSSEDYLKLDRIVSKEANLLTIDFVGNYNNNSFWNPASIDSIIFNSYVGAACIFEFHNREIELIRATTRYVETIGSVGMTLEDALQLRWSEHLDPRVLHNLDSSLRTSLEQNCEVSGDFIFYNLPGCSQKTYFHSTLRVIASVSDRFLVYCTNENITAQKEIEQENERSKQKIHRLTDDLTTLMNESPGGYAKLKVSPDGSSIPVYVNEGFCRMLGMTEKELRDLYFPDLMNGIHPDDRAIAIKSVKDAFAFNGRTSAKFRLLHKSGEYIWIQIFGRMTQDEDGNYYLNSYYTDLSPQDKLAISYQESVPILMNALMESTTDLAFAKDKDFKYLCCSNSYAHFAGQSSVKDVIGKTDYDLFPREYAERLRQDDVQLLSSEKSIVDHLESFPSKENLQRYAQLSKYVLKDSLGNIIGLYGSGQDVTESRLSHAQLEMLNNSIPGGIATYLCTENDIRLIYYNDGFCNLVECSREQYDQMTSTSCYGLIFEEDLPILFGSIKLLQRKGTPIDCTYRIYTYDHSAYKWVNLKGNIYESYGSSMLVHTVCFDVTELKKAEQEALSSQEALLRTNTLVDDSASAVYVCDSKTHKLLYLNKKCASLCNKPLDHALGQVCYSFLKGRTTPCPNCHMEHATQDNYTEFEYTNPDAGKHYMSRSKYIQWGKGMALVKYISDETERIQSRLTLEADQRAIEMASSNGGICFWRYDIDKKEMIWSGDNRSLYFDCPDVIANAPDYIIQHNLIHEEDTAEFLRMIKELEDDAERSEGTIRFYNYRSHEYIWNHIIYTRLHDTTYHTRRAVGCTINVDLQQQTKFRFEHEQMLRKDLIKDSLLYYELNLTTDMISNYQTKLSDIPGMQNAEPITDTIRESILKNTVKSDRALVRDNLFSDALRAAYRRGESSVTIKYRRYIPNVGIHWVKGSALIMKPPGSEDILAFLYFIDIDKKEINSMAMSSLVEMEIDSAMIVHVATGIASMLRDNDLLDSGYNPTAIDYDKFVHSKVMAYVVPEDQEPCLEFYSLTNLKKNLENEDAVFFSYDVKRGSRKIFRKRIVAFYLDDNQDYIVLSRKDVTKLHREDMKQKQALKKAVQAANDANNAKSDFLSHMSHDMRTPMNAIIGLVNLAKEEGASPPIMELLDNIDSSSHFLLGLINDVLDLSKIEHGKIDLHEEPYLMKDFCNSINTVILPLVQSKNITFDFHLESCPSCILIDPLRFVQIFFNLLSNAVKYTPEGGHVEFFSEQLPKKHGKTGIRYHVKDNGRGMTQAFLAVAFDPFSQEHEDAVNNLQGTGLGLSIVKNLVTIMGGKISIQSELGIGTEFIVDLYAEEAVLQKAVLAYTNEDYAKLKGTKILLADDNDLNLMITKKILDKYEIISEPAKNGLQAVEMFKSHAINYYDIILMDIRMPVMGGIKATERIRSFNRVDATTVPIIAMTADAFSDDRDKTIKAGMNAHITKPIEPDILYQTILKYTQRN